MIIPADHIQEGLEFELLPATERHRCEIVPDAIENGESPFQIYEGSFYQYHFNDESFRLENDNEVVVPFVKEKWKGTLQPNVYVGTLTLKVYRDDIVVGEIEIEVRSLKSSYRSDYRFMLEEITEYCMDLILQLNTPVSQSLTIDYQTDSETLLQRFNFISSIINSSDFKAAVQRIVSDPNSAWTTEHEEIDFRRVRRVGRNSMKKLVAGSNRQALPLDHPLSKRGIETVPLRITDTRKIDSYDTPENRFIKYALESYLAFLTLFSEKVSPKTREHKESQAMQNQLEEYLSHSLFKQVSRPASLKLNSPILQRKAGYREVLRSWVLFDLAAKLIWRGGDDVYKAGKRDVATLYEYWIFFKLLDLFSETFELDKADLNKLIVQTKDGVGLKVKQGVNLALDGVFAGYPRKLKIKFSYNRTFSGGNDFPNRGSWTINMRPDYTLSVWPAEFSDKEAEDLELITHIHFDAKYKIDNFLNLVDNIDVNEEKGDSIKSRYKHVDILKMHAYKDAIRRTGGAYVLYPGNTAYERNGFHEVMPGLGAFPLRPSKSANGMSDLKAFVLKVVDHLVDRATQREQSSINSHYIHKDEPDSKVQDPLPDYSGAGNISHPNETFVLVGYYSYPENLKWIKKKYKYNVRIGNSRGSIPIDKELASCKFLLLHTKDDQDAGLLFEIVENSGKLFTKDQLIKEGYPQIENSPSQPAYLVFDIRKVEASEFEGVRWKFKELKNYQSHRKSSYPFTASLSELMSVKNRQK